MKQLYKFMTALMFACLRAADMVFPPPQLVHAAALSKDANAVQLKRPELLSYPVYTAVTIYKGAMVCLNSSGYAVPAADTSGYSNVVGIAREQVVASSAASGTFDIRVDANCVALVTATSITQAMVGARMYVVDDQTVDDATISNNILAGILVRYVSATSGWILVSPAALPLTPSGSISGTLTVTSASASALAVGRLGATTPALQVDASAATQVTGLKITGNASGSGLALAVVGATNENLTIDAQGSGTISLNVTGTGAIVLARATSVTGAVTITSAGAASIAVGRQGATNPAFVVDSSTATQLTGLKVTAAGTGAGVAVAVIESGGTNNSLTVDAMGSGTITLGNTSTGIVIMGRGANKGIVQSYLKTSIATQNAAPTAAQMLGGYISHASATGAGTMTMPIGTNLSAAIPGVAVGDHFETLYCNTGNQTVTLTNAAGVTFVPATPATVATLKNALLRFVNTGTNTWDCFVASALG